MKKICVYITAALMLSLLPQAAFGAVELDSAETLKGIIITEPPQNGSLLCSGRALKKGSAVCASELYCIEYSAETQGEDSFAYIPVMNDGTAGEITRCYTSAEINTPPQVTDTRIKTYKNATVAGELGAYDADGDALEYTILTAPKKGRLTLDNGSFTYTPYLNKRGGDSFCYAVCDARGLWSREAVVDIDISRDDSDMVYADTDGEAWEYAALRLCEEGVYTGRQVAGKYYFGGSEPVTRGDFIVMAACAAGYEPQSGVTVFTDDAEIAAAARPYVAAAVSAGVVYGEASADGLLLRADDYITLAEAAVITDRLLGCADGVCEVTDMPDWAVKAATNLKLCGALPSGSGDCTASRGDCARLLTAVADSRAEEKGLFSWISHNKD